MNNDFAGYIDLLVQFITDSDERAYIVFSVPPKMTLQQCSTSVNESDNALLYCNATGNPVPNLAWISEKVREVVSQNKTLVLSTIKRNESGLYQCIAWNGIGNNITKNCTVDVHCEFLFIFIVIVLPR